MLGWHIALLRQQGQTRSQPATLETNPGVRLAVWQTGISGLDWLDELATAAQIVKLGGNGYPIRYTGLASELLPRIGNSPPAARTTWSHDPGDILTDGWTGKTTINESELALCAPDEWLIVEAWDES